MITIRPIQEGDLNNDWLDKALNSVKDCITAPILNLNPRESEATIMAKRLIDNFCKEGQPAIPTVVIPGGLIQMVLPDEDMLLSIIFSYPNNNTQIQVSLLKIEKP